MTTVLAVAAAVLAVLSVAYLVVSYATRKSHAPPYPDALAATWWDHDISEDL